MYIINLSEHPEAVPALWNKQIVSVDGKQMIFERFKQDGTVWLTIGPDDSGASFQLAMASHMNGEIGFVHPPIYDQFYQHLRVGSRTPVLSAAMFSNEELMRLLRTKDYHIG